MGAMAKLRRTMWRRHLHPASGWTRFLVAYGLMIAIWHHSWTWIAIGLVAVLTNPFWFPIAKRVDNFMSRAVLGEMVWLRIAGRGAQIATAAVGIVLAVALVWALWNRRLALALVLAAAFTAGKLAHLAWCGTLPRRHPDVGERVIAEVVTQRPEAAA